MPLPPDVLPCLRWLARRVCRRRPQAFDDCVQAGALALLHAPEYDPARNTLGGWVVAYAKGAMIDERDRGWFLSPRRERGRRAEGKPVPRKPAPLQRWHAGAAGEGYAAVEARDAVAFAAEALPGQVRILLRHHGEGEGCPALAEEAGIGRAAMWLRLRVAREKVRKRLAG